MTACPICRIATDKKREGTPYWVCANCSTWWQEPAPPKRWHGDHETWVGGVMSDAEKGANESLAKWLFAKAGEPRTAMDVGCGYPILAYYLKQQGCDAVGMDGDGLPNDLGIDVLQADFERGEGSSYDLITFVHTWEHLYDPVAAFKKCHEMLAKDGSLFIRMPDHSVAGYERDLTEGHYSIHPFYYCFASILELCYQTGLFTVAWTGELQPGQRDIFLTPR